MRIYQGRTLVGESVSYDDFLTRLGAAVVAGQDAPFLLVRDDDERLLISVRDSRILLLHACEERRTKTSYASTYLEGRATFRGLSKEASAAVDSFVDADFAIQAVRAFFERKRMSEYVDFRYGTPEPEILEFPEPMTIARKSERVERASIERFAEIPAGLRDDMKEVCEYLEEVEDDPDENIDYDDAIQIGGLCGGRLDARRGMYEFSYYAENEVWTFRLLRPFLDDIADGRLLRIKVALLGLR